MAYDKIIPVKNRLGKRIDYILDPEKTEIGRVLDYIKNEDKTLTPDGTVVLQTAINCQLETAYQEMLATKKRWSKPGGVQAYHLIHSYAPGEVTPTEAHALGVEFAQELLGERYEAVVATHLDHDHLHCHILFNSVSLLDGRKYRDNFKAYYGDIRGTSNAVSRKHGLSVIQPEGSGKSYAEWDANRKGKATLRGMVRQDIDTALSQSFTYASFLATLKKMGYEVKAGGNVKHTAVRPPGGSRFLRLDSLGDGYTEADLRRKLEGIRSGELPQEAPLSAVRPPPRRYTARRPVPRKQGKLHGFRALYVHYLFFLGIWQKPRPRRKQVPFAMRQDVTRLHRYQQQFRLLQEYRVSTDEDLSMLHDALQAEIDVLLSERKTLYKARRQGEDTTPEIDAINGKLRRLRSKVRLCESTQADIPHIREQTQTLHTPEPKESEAPQKTKSERRFTPWM